MIDSKSEPAVGVGRARDPSIDSRVLQAAARQLAAYGYEGMSVAAVAEEAGTTRQAVYRRWPGKAELGAAAMAAFADLTTGLETADPFGDLVAELTDFQHGVSRPGRLSLVGTMLQDSTDPGVRARYQAQVIAPRRRRLRLILERALRLGMIPADADLEVALAMCTGPWYARALAGAEPPPNWPRRTATLVWRAVGGTPPALPGRTVGE
ncbi:MAG TPA: TetR/AcrR family transcriptional regulator [Streptosporangiaceae bacterium]|nr:TetR/AcrR family transcriptional regulator [Streptosporangiaceae bacterium]